MIRRMKIILAIALICGSNSVSPALAQSDTASTKYFSAKVVNIRRAATGKTLVTVLFNSLTSESGYVKLYSGTAECRKSATLIDGDGNEYGTLRCMEAPGGSSTGMQIDGGTSSSFVYEFSTPISTGENARNNINILIPLYYLTCPKGDLYGNYNVADGCKYSTTTLSFYGLATK